MFVVAFEDHHGALETFLNKSFHVSSVFFCMHVLTVQSGSIVFGITIACGIIEQFV